MKKLRDELIKVEEIQNGTLDIRRALGRCTSQRRRLRVDGSNVLISSSQFSARRGNSAGFFYFKNRVEVYMYE